MPYRNYRSKKARLVKWIRASTALRWASVDSQDGSLRGTVSLVLDHKRQDDAYNDALDFLKNEGFREPLVCNVGPNYHGDTKTVRKHGDGHHRLAAAIDLGYKYIPYIFLNDYTFLEDCGDWIDEGPLIHPENPLTFLD